MMETMSAHALREAVSNAATTDAAFRTDLAKEGEKAVEARFGDRGVKVRVQLEDENELAILLPQKEKPFADALERLVKEVGDRTPTASEFEALIVYRAYTDPAFLARLQSDPRGAINSVLEKYGSSVPARATVHIYEEQAGECLILVRPFAADTEELSDTELEAVAGGGDLRNVIVNPWSVNGATPVHEVILKVAAVIKSIF